jgi:hypothetical protein
MCRTRQHTARQEQTISDRFWWKSPKMRTEIAEHKSFQDEIQRREHKIEARDGKPKRRQWSQRGEGMMALIYDGTSDDGARWRSLACGRNGVWISNPSFKLSSSSSWVGRRCCCHVYYSQPTVSRHVCASTPGQTHLLPPRLGPNQMGVGHVSSF